MTRRSGFTLVELLVVISVLAIILPMAGATVFFLLQAQSQSAESLRDAMAITQFSHTFRSDIHAARLAHPPAHPPADSGVLLELDDSRKIEYLAQPNGFVSRTVRRGEVVERREQFRVGAVHPKFVIAEAGREVGVTISPRIRGSALAADATKTAAGIHIAAVVGRTLGLGALVPGRVPDPKKTPPKTPSSPKDRKKTP
jgi:prepilin-type N-terminal cleavage/methylation domain-containing protein